jgi:hypothetical protein
MELAWNIALIGCAILFVAFSFVVAFGAPFLPTFNPKVTQALDMIHLKQGQTLLELGSGDGRVLKAAAQRGLKAVGYELNPLLVIYSRLLTWKYRKQVKIRWGNFWRAKWPPADGIFVFLLQPYMEKLDQKIVAEYGKDVRLVSFAFTINSRRPKKADTAAGLYLYQY